MSIYFFYCKLNVRQSDLIKIADREIESSRDMQKNLANSCDAYAIRSFTSIYLYKMDFEIVDSRHARSRITAEMLETDNSNSSVTQSNRNNEDVEVPTRHAGLLNSVI